MTEGWAMVERVRAWWVRKRAARQVSLGTLLMKRTAPSRKVGKGATGAPAAGMWATGLSTATLAIAESGEACGDGCSGPGGWAMGRLRAGGVPAGR